MNTTPVKDRLTSLETFSVWQIVTDEQQAAFDAVPFELDASNADQLKKQLGYLAAQEAQSAARQSLMIEIASQDDSFLSLPYRLGALAAFEITDKPLLTKHLANGTTVSKDLSLFHLDQHEQGIRPSSEPVELTAQIGDELERLQKLFDTDDSVPVVMVWNRRFHAPRLSYDEVVMGEVSNPRDCFSLQAPKVGQVDGRPVVDYKIPTRLQGVAKGRTIRRDEYIQSEAKYTSPGITTLTKLGVKKTGYTLGDADALYIGQADVDKRVTQARIDQRNYNRQIRLRQNHNPLHWPV